MFKDNHVLMKRQLESLKEEMFAKQKIWDEEKTQLVEELQTSAKRLVSAEQTIKAMEMEHTEKAQQLQEMDTVLLQLQKRLEGKEDERHCVEIEDNGSRRGLLFEKDRTWKEECEQLISLWKLSGDRAHKEALTTENRQLRHKLDLVQEELRTKETQWFLAFSMEQEKWGKERRALSGEKDALAKKNEQLQYQLQLVLDELRNQRNLLAQATGESGQGERESGRRK